MSHMNRREFCRHMAVLGGAAAAAPLLSACTRAADAPPAPTARPPAQLAPASATPDPPTPADTSTPPPAPSAQPTAQPTAAAGPGVVALVMTADRAEGVRRAVELLNPPALRGDRVLLKPNFNSADTAPGSTHPDVLQALVEATFNLGAAAITVGDRSGMGDTRAVMQQLGVFALASEMGFDTLVFDELSESEWVPRRDAGFHWAGGFAVPAPLLDADAVVQTCNLKTHRFGGHFTLSLKNSVGMAAQRTAPGGYNYMTELHNSAYQRQMIAEINTAYEPALLVMDAVEAFTTGGPEAGTKAAPGVVLAATDRVALDAVGVAILRMLGTTPEVSAGRVFEQTQIARAVELGLGVGAAEDIQLLTADAASAAYAGEIRSYLLA